LDPENSADNLDWTFALLAEVATALRAIGSTFPLVVATLGTENLTFADASLGGLTAARACVRIDAARVMVVDGSLFTDEESPFITSAGGFLAVHNDFGEVVVGTASLCDI
jgi:hypothetical protein